MPVVAHFEGALALLDAFITWLGQARLQQAHAPLLRPDLGPLRYAQQLQQQWVVRDLLTYIAARDAGDVPEELVFEQLMPLSRLASAVLRFDRAGALPVPGRFRDLLVREACADYACEVIAAAHHDAKGYHIRWLPEGAIGGEFAARTDDDAQEVFVECKRLARDAVERLKAPVAAELADRLSVQLQAQGRCGTLAIDIGPRHVETPRFPQVLDQLAQQFVDGQGTVRIDDVRVTFDLGQANQTTRLFSELFALAQQRGPTHRIITGERIADLVRRPCVFDMQGPRRSNDWFARKVESVVVGDAADRQLSADAPGAVFLELPMFCNVSPEDALLVLEPVIATLFERPHVIGLFAVLDQTTKVVGGAGMANAPGRVVWNTASRFPGAQALWQQRMSGQ